MSVYRSRLKNEYSRETAHFVSSLVEDARIFEDDILGTEAHDIMLHEQGLLSREELAKILGSLEKLRRARADGALRLEGNYEDVHELIEASVIRDIGPEIGGKLHSGRSRNDQVATDIRMRLREDLVAVSEAVIDLVRVCLVKAEMHKASAMVLYTHTQQAQIGTFGHYVLAFSEALLRDFQRIQDALDRVNLSPLGAGPVGGTVIPINRHRTAVLLGFDGLVRNSLDATSSRDFMAETMASLSTLMITVSRVAEDLILWSSSEFGFVELAEEFASVSSIMPQKKNPTVLELVRGKVSRVTADLNAVLGILKSVPSGYSSDLQETKPLLWDSLDQTLSSLHMLTKVLDSLTIHEDRMRDIARKSYVFAVDLAERLSLDGLLPFRQSHAIVGGLVRNMAAQGLEPSALAPELIEAEAEKVLGRKIRVPKSMVREVRDLRKILKSRSSIGSPNPRQVEDMLAESLKRVSEAAAIISTRKQKIESAKAELSKNVSYYVDAHNTKYVIDKYSALIIVDTQKCFCRGGSLPVPEGDGVVPVLNEYVGVFHKAGSPIYATRDWHPPNHMSFKARGGPWPPHCIQGTEDAALHSGLQLPPMTEIISKATDPDREAYSGFDGTGLAQLLKEKGLKRVFVGGLATDYCVKNTVLDALREGFETVLLTDAIRGVEVKAGDSKRAVEEMVRSGALLAGRMLIEPVSSRHRRD